MSPEDTPATLDEIRAFAVRASRTGKTVAHFARDAATFTPAYREPGVDSIDEIDSMIGDAADVVDPLLTAHRLAKFYVISAGDALLSCCDLVGRDYPMHVGSAALARVAAEHSAKAMYLSDPSVDWKTRVIRAHVMHANALSEYKSTNEPGARAMIKMWSAWRARTSKTFAEVKKQSASNARRLIESQFGDTSAYDELSRPTHGNTVWVMLAVVQEQKRTNYAWTATLRNTQFAIDTVLQASARICALWGLDPEEIFSASNARLGVPEFGHAFATMVAVCDDIRSNVNYLSRTVVIDSTEDPQLSR